MKKSRILAFFCVLICITTLIIPTTASTERASDQISLYWIDPIITKGAVNIEFSITGKTIMNKLGCESIYLYEKSGSAWIYEDSMTENDPGMSTTNRVNHANTISFDGIAGVEYKVVVTVFAQNDAGRDTRTQTFYVTGK